MSADAQRGHFERCGNRGPRVGEDVYRCGRPAGHRGNHWPDPHGGWEAITWSEPDRREPAEQGQFERVDLWHRPKPGPMYWDWRCLVCSEPVASHPSWWARLRRRWVTP